MIILPYMVVGFLQGMFPKIQMEDINHLMINLGRYLAQLSLHHIGQNPKGEEVYMNVDTRR